MLHKMKKSLTDLLILAKEGDEIAYREFLIEASVFVRRILSKWLKNSEIREEIVQESLISIHQNLHTFQLNLKAEPWISTISRYKVIDFFRKNKHFSSHISFEVTNLNPDSYFVLNEVSEEDYWNDWRDLFYLELSKLDNIAKDAIIKTKIEEKSTKAAASELGINENALRTRVSRGLQKLKKSLEGN